MCLVPDEEMCVRKSKELKRWAGYQKGVTGWASKTRSEGECVRMGRSNLVSGSWEPGESSKITTKSLTVPSWEKDDFMC